MKINKWTLGLATVGVVSLASALQAEEKASPLMTALSSTTISGYVDTSAQWNFGTGNANNPGYSFGGATKADGFNLNAAMLTIQKPLDPQDNWAAGYKVQLVYGMDNVVAGPAAPVKQAYVNLRAPVGNGLEFKIGRFDTIIGYEVFEAGSNPNFTRSYGYTIEPTEHTGVLAAYRVNDLIGVSVGVANTRDQVANRSALSESSKSYMGALTLTAPKELGFLEGSTLYAGIVIGDDGATAVSQQNYYVGGTLNTPIKVLKIGASYDYRGQSAKTGTAASGYANATALYGSFQLTEKITLHNRLEYASGGGAAAGWIGGAMSRELFAETFTVQYDLWKNVISRVEFRWDHDLTGNGIYGGTTPGVGNNLKNAIMVAGDRKSVV